MDVGVKGWRVFEVEFLEIIGRGFDPEFKASILNWNKRLV